MPRQPPRCRRRARLARDGRLGWRVASAAVFALVASCLGPARADRAYVVAPGDTLYAVADRFGTTVAELRSANGLTGSLLRPGEVLRVPGADASGYRTTIARTGETLAAVAARVGRTPATLASANPVLARSGVRAGAAVSVPPADGATVIATQGETLPALAARTGAPAAVLARVNGLAADAPLEAGQPVLVPADAGSGPQGAAADAAGGAPALGTASGGSSGGPAGVTSAPVEAAAAPASASADPAPAGASPDGAASPTLSTMRAAAAPKGATPRERLEAMQNAALLAAVVRLPSVRLSENGFIAPVHGRLSSPFGWRALSVNGNHFHAGIDLAVPMGTPIHAARDGTVVEARWDGTYGNVVFLDHGDGSQTRYAHMSRIAVHAGERVRQGDVLGYAGSTGWSTGPHVHFELRFDGRAVDPLDYLRGSAIH